MSGWQVPGYTEVRELGRGGAGVVVLATHDATGTPVAIKYLLDHDVEGGTDDDGIARFRAEARLLAEVDDPYVARLYEYVETDVDAAIVMELVDGVSLRAMLREHGPTEPEAALAVLKGSLLGLGAAHAHQVVHRDYKPENVLVDQAGHSKLTDFGIALRAGHTGSWAGTPPYMAPEQWYREPATIQTDIYAATATFYECLTGTPPYQAENSIALGLQHQRAPIPVGNVPEPLRDLIGYGLAKSPDDRPPNAHALLAELETIAGQAYGPDWEERGRSQLVQRVALLALLLPTAGQLVSSSAVATTTLRRLRWSRRLLIGVGAAAIIATIGAAVALVPNGSTPVSGQPPVGPTASQPALPPAGATATPTVTPLASATPSAAPTPAPTPGGTGGQPPPGPGPQPPPGPGPQPPPGPGPQPPPPPGPGPQPPAPQPPAPQPPAPQPPQPPPPPPLAVTDLSVSFDCAPAPCAPGQKMEVVVVVKTNGTGQVNLTLTLTGSNGSGGPVPPAHQLSGSVQYVERWDVTVEFREVCAGNQAAIAKVQTVPENSASAQVLCQPIIR